MAFGRCWDQKPKDRYRENFSLQKQGNEVFILQRNAIKKAHPKPPHWWPCIDSGDFSYERPMFVDPPRESLEEKQLPKMCPVKWY